MTRASLQRGAGVGAARGGYYALIDFRCGDTQAYACVGTIRCTNDRKSEHVEDCPAEIGRVGFEASSEAKRPGHNSVSQRPGGGAQSESFSTEGALELRQGRNQGGRWS